MHVSLAESLKTEPAALRGQELLKSCVHCGFCNATCPTYQQLGDEQDGPRGRIYRLGNILEGKAPSRLDALHFDRCLTCLNCETTCPSGVRYSGIIDLARDMAASQRPRMEQWLRKGLVSLLLHPLTARLYDWFRPVLRLSGLRRGNDSQAFRAVQSAPATPLRGRVMLFEGCVQPYLMPEINAATEFVLHRLGYEVIRHALTDCCGALHHHTLGSPDAEPLVTGNVRQWHSWLEDDSIHAILVNASGCGAFIQRYPLLLEGHEAGMALQAEKVTRKTHDLLDFIACHGRESLAQMLAGIPTAIKAQTHLAFHPPCTLQHGLQIRGVMESLLSQWGYAWTAIPDAHLCCGAAGSYTILQPAMARQLRDKKLGSIARTDAARLLSANIGCLHHLQTASQIPVHHWIIWLAGQIQYAERLKSDGQ